MKPDKQWLESLLADVGLADRRKHRPSELSGGQQQRVAIARALVSRPTVLFADEPTGNLDSATSGEILELLRNSVKSRGQTTVMVTHDPRAATIADRILFLADGLIVRELAGASQHEILEALKEVQALMRRVALKGLAWRKIRGVLTALAIVLGVAMVSGAFVLTDTMKKAADELESSSYAGIDGIVTGVASFRDDNSWQKTPSISQSLVAKVQRVPQVGTVVGSVLDQAKLVNAKGEVIGSAAELRRRHRRGAAGRPIASTRSRSARDAGRRGPARSRSTRERARREHLGVGDTVGVVATRARAQVHDRRPRQVGESSTRSARRRSPRST